MLILAASTQRTIGLVIALTVAVAFAVYVLVNVFSTGRDEIGSEIELAPNRKPYYDDAELETKKLDLSLAFGVGTLAIIALALPLYWLGEPGRQQGYLDLTGNQFASRGGEQYEALCVACHGAGGVGGGAAYTVLDEEGRFVSGVNWTAPALNTVLYRFSEDEVLHILNYGRPQSPMPAWGGPGGGPLTTQQLEELIAWMRTIQLTPEEMTAEVQQGLRDQIRATPRGENPEVFATASSTAGDGSDGGAVLSEADIAAAREQVYALYDDLIDGFGELVRTGDDLAASPDATVEDIQANRDAQDAALDSYIADLYERDIEAYGGLIFNNPAGAGSYGCARCHTSGASWNADDVLAADPALTGLIHPEVSGGGGFGPSLLGVEDQFTSADAQGEFITGGCSSNLQYGTNGVCEPSGQMPGFGVGASDLEGALLSPEQIAAVVAYERGLN